MVRICRKHWETTTETIIVAQSTRVLNSVIDHLAACLLHDCSSLQYVTECRGRKGEEASTEKGTVKILTVVFSLQLSYLSVMWLKSDPPSFGVEI